jgi:4a-hydroxytetrahydrobiopterin dehydratase
MATLLDGRLVDDTLASLPGWNHGDGDLWREVHLPKEADAALRREVEADATAMDHHVTVEQVKGGTRFSLRTEDVGGVSELDIALASRISDLAHRLAEQAGGDEPGVNAVRRDEPDTVVEADSAPPPAATGLGDLLGKR